MWICRTLLAPLLACPAGALLHHAASGEDASMVQLNMQASVVHAAQSDGTGEAAMTHEQTAGLVDKLMRELDSAQDQPSACSAVTEGTTKEVKMLQQTIRELQAKVASLSKAHPGCDVSETSAAPWASMLQKKGSDTNGESPMLNTWLMGGPSPSDEYTTRVPPPGQDLDYYLAALTSTFRMPRIFQADHALPGCHGRPGCPSTEHIINIKDDDDAAKRQWLYHSNATTQLIAQFPSIPGGMTDAMSGSPSSHMTAPSRPTYLDAAAGAAEAKEHAEGDGGTTGSDKPKSKWDEILNNGFKQMKSMLKPSETEKPRSWAVLVVFVILAIFFFAAMLLVAAPRISMANGAAVKGGKALTAGKGGSPLPNANEDQPEPVNLKTGFIQLALPYWLPTTPTSRGSLFLALMGSLIVSSLAVNFWIAQIGIAIVRATDEDIRKSVDKVGWLNNDALKVIAAVLCGVAPLFFFINRRQLAGRRRQWFFLAFKVFLVFEAQVVTIISSYMMRMQMNNFVALNADRFWHITRTLQMGIVIIGIIDAGLGQYVNQVLLLEWRRFLTEYVLSRYMGTGAYYKMNSNSGTDDGADNPDQRMQGDTQEFISNLNEFVFSVISTVMTLVSSTIIVWAVLPNMTMILLGYSIVGSMISLWFTWNFVRLNYRIQKAEADYRYSMVHVRDNAEGIAFYGGEQQGEGQINQRFDEVVKAKYQIIVWGMFFGGFSFLYTAGGTMVPMILLARNLFQGKMDVGSLTQVGSNFGSVISSLSFINNSSSMLASLSTSTLRLSGLLTRIDQVNDVPEISRTVNKEGKVTLKNLSVQTPDGRWLSRDIQVSIGGAGAPARLIVVGRSGIGKSSLLRTLAGLWNQGRGEVSMPPKCDCMFLPQKPYMPLGSLRQQLCYPAKGNSANDADLRSMLEELGLGDLPDRFEDGFDTVLDWARTLSLGEQQRIAAIRSFIQQPKMVVLDESTSALSIIDENTVYRRFSQMGISYISVGHRTTIIKFHEKVLELKGNGDWSIHVGSEWLDRAAQDEEQAKQAIAGQNA